MPQVPLSRPTSAHYFSEYKAMAKPTMAQSNAKATGAPRLTIGAKAMLAGLLAAAAPHPAQGGRPQRFPLEERPL